MEYQIPMFPDFDNKYQNNINNSTESKAAISAAFLIKKCLLETDSWTDYYSESELLNIVSTLGKINE